MSDPIILTFSGDRRGVLALMEIIRQHLAHHHNHHLVRVIDHDNFELVVDCPRT